jgi:Arc/MetJ-type ribon-helix-helix transcriptional regulator
LKVTLKPEIEQRIAEEVEAGGFTNPDEFLNKAVYHYLIARDLGEDYTREEVEEKDCARFGPSGARRSY